MSTPNGKLANAGPSPQNGVCAKPNAAAASSPPRGSRPVRVPRRSTAYPRYSSSSTGPLVNATRTRHQRGWFAWPGLPARSRRAPAHAAVVWSAEGAHSTRAEGWSGLRHRHCARPTQTSRRERQLFPLAHDEEHGNRQSTEHNPQRKLNAQAWRGPVHAGPCRDHRRPKQRQGERYGGRVRELDAGHSFRTGIPCDCKPGASRRPPDGVLPCAPTIAPHAGPGAWASCSAAVRRQ